MSLVAGRHLICGIPIIPLITVPRITTITIISIIPIIAIASVISGIPVILGASGIPISRRRTRRVSRGGCCRLRCSGWPGRGDRCTLGHLTIPNLLIQAKVCFKYRFGYWAGGCRTMIALLYNPGEGYFRVISRGESDKHTVVDIFTPS
jgi:hypothetical protein